MGEVLLTEEADGTVIEARKGDTIVVTLEQNLTTGYSWSLDEYDPSVLSAAEEESSIPDTPDLLGAPGARSFTFEALREGETSVRLLLIRPWEEWNPARTFTVSVRVQS